MIDDRSDEQDQDHATATDRRDLVKKIGVGAAATWLAPAVLSTQASAQGSTEQPPPPPPPPPPPEPVLDVDQPLNNGGWVSVSKLSDSYILEVRQPFVAGVTGPLSEIVVWGALGAAGIGPLRVEVYAADVAGNPTGPVLGSGQLAEPATVNSFVAHTIPLSSPAAITSGSRYVLVFSTPQVTFGSGYRLSFGNTTIDGFPYAIKYNFQAAQQPATNLALYLKTYVG